MPPPEQPDDLQQDLAAFLRAHEQQEQADAPPDETVVVRTQAVQMAMKELAALERERAEALRQGPEHAAVLTERIALLERTYRNIEGAEIVRQGRGCPRQPNYRHTIFSYRWFDESSGRLRTSPEAECCHAGLCETADEAADQALFAAKLEAWEGARLAAEHLGQNVPRERTLAAVREIEGRMRTYRAVIEQSLQVVLPELSAGDLPTIEPPANPLGERPQFTPLLDPRLPEEQQTQRERVIARLNWTDITRDLLATRDGHPLQDGDRYLLRHQDNRPLDDIRLIVSPDDLRDEGVIVKLLGLMDRAYDPMQIGVALKPVLTKQVVLKALQEEPFGGYRILYALNYVPELRHDLAILRQLVRRWPEYAVLLTEEHKANKSEMTQFAQLIHESYRWDFMAYVLKGELAGWTGKELVGLLGLPRSTLALPGGKYHCTHNGIEMPLDACIHAALQRLYFNNAISNAFRGLTSS